MSTPLPALFELRDDQAVRLEVPGGPANLDRALLDLPDGVYEALRTRGGARFFRLERHCARAAEGCARAGLPPLDEDLFHRGLDACTRAWGHEAKVRIDLCAEPPAAFGAQTRILYSFRPLVLPTPEVYADGVGVRIAEGLARHDPEVKGTAFIAQRARRPLLEDDYESVLVDEHGYLLECVMSNLFLVRGGELRTAGHGVLLGVTRETVLGAAQSLGMPVREEAVHRDEVEQLEEAFLTTSVRGLVPIVRLGGVTLGTGRPGPWTQRLSEAYEDAVERGSARAWPREP
ncbi:MAG: aminotransferase class IV [Planctomycetota bacterium]|nr:aminotransferase class IV [Planctomycetota bacterium]